MVGWIEVWVSGISGRDVYIVDMEFFLSGEVQLDVLDLCVSGVYWGWSFIVGEDYVTSDVGD